MLFLKSLLFPLSNVFIAFLFVSAIRQILFYPRKKVYIFGKHIPLTPGLVVKYHSLVLDKINGILNDFFRDLETDHEDNRVKTWEDKVFERCFTWAESRFKSKFIPQKILIAIRVFAAEIGREFASQFLRSFVPYMMETLNISHYIDLVNYHFTLANLQKYYDKYVYLFSLIIMCSFALFIGIVNQLIYLIIGG